MAKVVAFTVKQNWGIFGREREIARRQYVKSSCCVKMKNEQFYLDSVVISHTCVSERECRSEAIFALGGQPPFKSQK